MDRGGYSNRDPGEHGRYDDRKIDRWRLCGCRKRGRLACVSYCPHAPMPRLPKSNAHTGPVNWPVRWSPLGNITSNVPEMVVAPTVAKVIVPPCAFSVLLVL